MKYDCIQIDRSSAGWATITLCRAEKLNALSIKLRQELDHAVCELEQDPAIHVLILTAVGKAFTAGLDLDEWSATASQPAAAAYEWDSVVSLRRFTGPVIAAVGGLAVTGGLEIVLACDLVVASQQARFADTHVRMGLIPGWGGSARLLARVGIHRAKELALTGRFFSAQEALQWGLVNHVVEASELLQFAQGLATDMLKAKPEHLKAYKQLLDAESMLPLAEALTFERSRSIEVNSHTSLQDIQARLQALSEG